MTIRSEVEVEEPFLISFSQANTFNTCRRNWSYQKVDQLKRLFSWYTYWGSRVHKQIEDAFLGEDKAPRSTPAQNAYNFVHNKHDAVDIFVETELRSEVVDGVQIRGFADIIFTQIIELAPGPKMSVRTLADWKTKASSPDAPSAENWNQVQLYAYLHGGIDQVCIYYPEYDKAYYREANSIVGKQVHDELMFTGQLILNDEKIRTTKGDDQVATPNKNCFFCDHQARCTAVEEDALLTAMVDMPDEWD